MVNRCKLQKSLVIIALFSWLDWPWPDLLILLFQNINYCLSRFGFVHWIIWTWLPPWIISSTNRCLGWTIQGSDCWSSVSSSGKRQKLELWQLTYSAPHYHFLKNAQFFVIWYTPKWVIKILKMMETASNSEKIPSSRLDLNPSPSMM